MRRPRKYLFRSVVFLRRISSRSSKQRNVFGGYLLQPSNQTNYEFNHSHSSYLHNINDILFEFSRHNPGIEENYIKIRKAYVFASIKHRGQKRADGTDYITHPIEVAYAISKMGYGHHVIIGALLHDVVEDCGVHIDEVRSMFGGDVTNLLVALTKPKLINGKWVWSSDAEFYSCDDEYEGRMRDERAEIYYDTIFSSQNMDAIMIKLVDAIHNYNQRDNLPDWKRDRNVKTMLDGILWAVPNLFSIQKAEELFGGDIWLEAWDTNRVRHKFIVVTGKRVPSKSLFRNIEPSRLTVYVGKDGIELGVKGGGVLDKTLRLLTRIFRIYKSESLVPDGVSAHEEIYKIPSNKQTNEA